jgi:hypothetical protein
MNLAVGQTSLVLGESGKNGYFIFPDGSESEKFGTKETAFSEVEKAYVSERISFLDLKKVLHTVVESTLPSVYEVCENFDHDVSVFPIEEEWLTEFPPD